MAIRWAVPVAVSMFLGGAIRATPMCDTVAPTELHDPYEVLGGCGECLSCIPPDPAFGHVFWEWAYGPKWGEMHMSCYIGPCDHPPCGLALDRDRGDMDDRSRQVLASVEHEVVDGRPVSAATAALLLRLYPERVSLNEARSALQMHSTCSPERIVAHVPLSQTGMAELARIGVATE